MAKGRKTYPDLRYFYMRGLIDWELWQRKRHYLKQAAEWTSKAIVSLELAEEPVKSVGQAMQLEGIGHEIGKKLASIAASATFDPDPPSGGRFVSSAGALLVALHLCGEGMKRENPELKGSPLVPLSVLQREAPQYSCEKFLTHDQEEKKAALCPAWWRISVLINRGFVKKRTSQRLPVYELLPAGQQLAVQLIASAGIKQEQKTTQPVVDKENRAADMEALYTNDDGSDGVVMFVDTQEWGGDRVGLGELCGMLKQTGIRYRTVRLPVCDYVWIWRCGEQIILLPVLIERKRMDDLARSLVDGRYTSQKDKMVALSERMKAKDVDATLKYLVEGEAEMYKVRCRDGCGAIVKCGFPTVLQIEQTLAELDEDEQFELIQTKDIQSTVHFLATISNELKHRIENGEMFDLLMKEMDFDMLMSVPKDGDVHVIQTGNQDEIDAADVEKRDVVKGPATTARIKLDHDAPRSRGNANRGVPATPAQSEAVLQAPGANAFAQVPLAQYHSAIGPRTISGRRQPTQDLSSASLRKGEIPSFTAMYKPELDVKPSFTGAVVAQVDDADKVIYAGNKTDVKPQTAKISPPSLAQYHSTSHQKATTPKAGWGTNYVKNEICNESKLIKSPNSTHSRTLNSSSKFSNDNMSSRLTYDSCVKLEPPPLSGSPYGRDPSFHIKADVHVKTESALADELDSTISHMYSGSHEIKRDIPEILDEFESNNLRPQCKVAANSYLSSPNRGDSKSKDVISRRRTASALGLLSEPSEGPRTVLSSTKITSDKPTTYTELFPSYSPKKMKFSQPSTEFDHNHHLPDLISLKTEKSSDTRKSGTDFGQKSSSLFHDIKTESSNQAMSHKSFGLASSRFDDAPDDSSDDDLPDIQLGIRQRDRDESVSEPARSSISYEPDDETVKMIKAIVPDVSYGLIVTKLRTHHGNVEAVVNELLEEIT